MLRNRAFDQHTLLQADYPSLPDHPAHGKVASLQKTCAECFHTFSTNSHLEQHASSSGHTSFSCTCGAQFSRAYTLTRHINSKIGVSFQCDLCDDKAFPRLDKLGDHLRRWHRLGGKAFDLYKGGSSPPSSASVPTASLSHLQAEAPEQACPMMPKSGSASMFDGFPLATNATTAYSSSAETSVSPQSFIVSSRFPASRTTNSPS